MNERAVPSIVPHSGVGGCTPRPRNPRPAAIRIVTPMLSVAYTMIGVSALRSTCLPRIASGVSPNAIAAST